MRVVLAMVLLALSGLAVGGCATIAPYERETLARPDMALEGDPAIAAADEHALEVREASTGGFGSAGGGCGCN